MKETFLTAGLDWNAIERDREEDLYLKGLFRGVLTEIADACTQGETAFPTAIEEVMRVRVGVKFQTLPKRWKLAEIGSAVIRCHQAARAVSLAAKRPSVPVWKLSLAACGNEWHLHRKQKQKGGPTVYELVAADFTDVGMPTSAKQIDNWMQRHKTKK